MLFSVTGIDDQGHRLQGKKIQKKILDFSFSDNQWYNFLHFNIFPTFLSTVAKKSRGGELRCAGVLIYDIVLFQKGRLLYYLSLLCLKLFWELLLLEKVRTKYVLLLIFTNSELFVQTYSLSQWGDKRLELRAFIVISMIYLYVPTDSG